MRVYVWCTRHGDEFRPITITWNGNPKLVLAARSLEEAQVYAQVASASGEILNLEVILCDFAFAHADTESVVFRPIS
jgi:hypothetical protein